MESLEQLQILFCLQVFLTVCVNTYIKNVKNEGEVSNCAWHGVHLVPLRPVDLDSTTQWLLAFPWMVDPNCPQREWLSNKLQPSHWFHFPGGNNVQETGNNNNNNNNKTHQICILLIFIGNRIPGRWPTNVHTSKVKYCFFYGEQKEQVTHMHCTGTLKKKEEERTLVKTRGDMWGWGEQSKF